MQKTFTVSYLTKQHIRNTGQLNQYFIEDDHPAIIPREEWDAVQEEIARRKRFREEHGLRGLSSGSGTSPFYGKVFCEHCGCKLQRIYRKGVKKPYWSCLECGLRMEDSTLRARFCDAYNSIVERRSHYLPGWEEQLRCGSALERVRARQMAEVTAGGTIPLEVPELTQAILQEAWLGPDVMIRFIFLSGDRVDMPG